MPAGEVIINPKREKGDPVLGPEAIMVAVASDLTSLVHLSGAERVSLKTLSPFKLFLEKKDSDPPVALAGPFLGAPHAVIVMEKLIALGAKRIWMLGWCGSLQPSIQIGDLIIPTSALPEEGTSSHYPVNEKKRQTSSLLNRRLEDALLRSDLPFTRGPIWTTDAIYRETHEKVLAYGKRGLLAVEMELSALITLALYRSVEFAGLLVVSDELSTLEWRYSSHPGTLKKRSTKAGHLLLDLCMHSS